VPSGR